MASETVDPIDWSHPPPYTGQYPLSSTYCTLQWGLGCKRQDVLHSVSRDRATFGMPDQRTACAATQGIRVLCRVQCQSTVFLKHRTNWDDVSTAVKSFTWSTILKSADTLVSFNRAISEVIGRYRPTTVLRRRSIQKQWFDASCQKANVAKQNGYHAL